MGNDKKLGSSSEITEREVSSILDLQHQLADRIARADRLSEDVAELRVTLASERAALSYAREQATRGDERLRAVNEEVETRRKEALNFGRELTSLAAKLSTAENQLRIEKASARTTDQSIAVGDAPRPPSTAQRPLAKSASKPAASRRSIKRRLKAWANRLLKRHAEKPQSPPKNEREAMAMILASGLFDAEWYLAKYRDVREAKAAPLEHFLHHGGSEGRSPGPDFDTRWYVSQDAGISKSGLNPLIHFVTQGRAKGHKPAPPANAMLVERRKDVMELLSTPLFDSAWYRAQVPGLPKGNHNVAAHYLDHGWKQGKNPGPQFDAAAYLAQNADVAEAQANPLLHFIRHGQNEGRKITPASGSNSRRHTPPSARQDQTPAKAITSRSPTAQPWPWRKIAEFATDNLRTLGGVAIGFLPTTSDLEQQSEDLLRTFEYLSRGRRPQIHQEATLSLQSSHPISDAWFVTRFDLRLRLTSTSPSNVALRAFQWDMTGGELRLLSEQSVAIDILGIADVRLANPYSPLLIILDDGDGAWIDAQVIAYPSLARNGDHHAELASVTETLSGLNQSLADRQLAKVHPTTMISTIKIDTAYALGGERVLTQAFSDWARGVLGIELTTTDNGKISLPSQPATPTPRPKGRTLEIGHDQLPTIGALISTPADHGAFLIADVIRGKPRWMIAPGDIEVPAAAQPTHGPSSLARLSPIDPETELVSPPHSGALTIRFMENETAEDATLLFPISPDAPGALFSDTSPLPHIVTAILVVETDTDMESLRLTMEALRAQQEVEVSVIIAAPSIDSVPEPLQAIFPDLLVIEAGRTVAHSINMAAEKVQTPLFLTLEIGMMLHDVRTLAGLASLVTLDNIATASCAVVQASIGRGDRMLRFFSAGVFPMQMSFSGTPTLTFCEPLAASALPLSTFSVAANRRRLTAYKKSSWDAAGGFPVHRSKPGDEDIAFGLQAIMNGELNVCTTAITALAPEQKTFNQSIDPIYSDTRPATEWVRLLSGLSVLKSLS